MQKEEEQLASRAETERLTRKLQDAEKRVDEQKEVTRKQHNEVVACGVKESSSAWRARAS